MATRRPFFAPRLGGAAVFQTRRRYAGKCAGEHGRLAERPCFTPRDDNEPSSPSTDLSPFWNKLGNDSQQFHDFRPAEWQKSGWDQVSRHLTRPRPRWLTAGRSGLTAIEWPVWRSLVALHPEGWNLGQLGGQRCRTKCQPLSNRASNDGGAACCSRTLQMLGLALPGDGEMPTIMGSARTYSQTDVFGSSTLQFSAAGHLQIQLAPATPSVLCLQTRLAGEQWVGWL